MDEEKSLTSQETSANALCKCPHCACCFCNNVDLKKHLETFGGSQVGHQQEFQKVHGRLEHGSFGGPE